MEGLDPINWFNHTSWVAIVTPTDRPKSACNRCVISVFGGVFVLSRCFLDVPVGEGAFVIGLSQISSFSLMPLMAMTSKMAIFRTKVMVQVTSNLNVI